MLPLYGKESSIPDHETHNWSLKFLVNREANNSDQKEFFYYINKALQVLERVGPDKALPFPAMEVCVVILTWLQSSWELYPWLIIGNLKKTRGPRPA